MGWDGMRWDEMGDVHCWAIRRVFSTAQWQPSSLRTPRLGDVKSQFNMVRKSAVHRVNCQWTVKEIRHNNKCRSTRQSHEQNMVRMTRYGDNYFFLGWVPKKSTLCWGDKFWNKWKNKKSNLSDLSEPWVFYLTSWSPGEWHKWFVDNNDQAEQVINV